MFPHAKNLVITGGTFTMQGEFHSHTHITGNAGLSLLQQKIAPGAFHNSDERYDPPKCHPRTREAVLKKIMEWVKDPEKLTLFMWLYGPAGSGKSAIGQTIAEMCYEAGLLVATFFFSRSITGRNEKTYLITTLVYQMILVVPEIRDQVVKALEYNPALFSLSLKAQIQALIVQPLNDAFLRIVDDNDRQILMSRPRFIILDGLDECNDPQAQVYILEVLVAAVKQLSVPLFFLVASRPEQQIRDAFNEDVLSELTTTLVLDDTYRPNADIKILLESKFDEIKRKHPSRAHFPKPWPSEKEIYDLVEKSSGQFIYATTVIKYIESRRHLPPDRLGIVLGLSDPGNDTPFAELDALYNHILSSVISVDKVIKLFIILLFTSFSKKPQDIQAFLFYRPGEIDIILSDLHSLIAVPPPEDIKSQLRISHASLGDFLLDRSRSGKFFIDAGVGHAEILGLLLKHLVQDRDKSDQYRDWSTKFMNHYLKAHPTPELVDDLHNFDLLGFLDFMTVNSSPSPSAVRPATGFWTKVPVDERWPNMAQVFFWLQKLRHPDPNKDFYHYYLSTYDTWLYTQLNRYYPHEASTTYLFTAATLDGFQTSSLTKAYEIIHAVCPWTDFDTLKWKDPVHLYDQYLRSGDAGVYYYGAITQFLTDASRSKEYYVDENKYASFAKLLMEFILKQDLHDQPKNHYRAELVKLPLNLFSQALAKSAKVVELATFLQDHSLRCSDLEHPLYAEMNEVASKVDSYLNEFKTIES